jgi:hypothetical protein
MKFTSLYEVMDLEMPCKPTTSMKQIQATKDVFIVFWQAMKRVIFKNLSTITKLEFIAH